MTSILTSAVGSARTAANHRTPLLFFRVVAHTRNGGLRRWVRDTMPAVQMPSAFRWTSDPRAAQESDPAGFRRSRGDGLEPEHDTTAGK